MAPVSRARQRDDARRSRVRGDEWCGLHRGFIVESGTVERRRPRRVRRRIPGSPRPHRRRADEPWRRRQPRIPVRRTVHGSDDDCGLLPDPQRPEPWRFHAAHATDGFAARLVPVHAPGAAAHRTPVREQQRRLHRGDAGAAECHVSRGHVGGLERESSDLHAAGRLVVYRVAVDSLHGGRADHRGPGNPAARQCAGFGGRLCRRPRSGPGFRARAVARKRQRVILFVAGPESGSVPPSAPRPTPGDPPCRLPRRSHPRPSSGPYGCA